MDDFVLDAEVIIDVAPSSAAAPCGTSDGCAPTCASACTSK